MELFSVVVFSIATIVTANTGSSINLSKQDTCSVPVDVITELQTLRSLQNQDSKITLDLGKQVMDLQKELHQLRAQSSATAAPTQESKMTPDLSKQFLHLQKEFLQLRTQFSATPAPTQESQRTLDLEKEVQDLQQKYTRLQTQYTTSIQENQKMRVEIETLRFNVSEVEQKSKVIEEWKEVSSAAMTDLTSGVNRKPTGSVFTRWGRTTCPANTSELVYSGRYENMITFLMKVQLCSNIHFRLISLNFLITYTNVRKLTFRSFRPSTMEFFS